MKWDSKVFIIFILIVLIIGGSYFLSSGIFFFPIEIIDLAISGVALTFLFTTPFSLYSAIIALFGFSLTYLLFGVKQMIEGDPTFFMLIRDFTILIFSILLFVRVLTGRDKKFRGLFLFFALIVLMQLIFNGVNFSVEKLLLADLIKSLLVFVCSVLIVNQSGGGELKLSIRRVFILLGLYSFRNVLALIATGNLI